MAKSTFSNEEKQKIVNESRESGSVAKTAKRYSISAKTIYNWSKDKLNKKDTQSSDKDFKAQIKKLKAQLDDSKLENSVLKDILKKTVHVWTHEDQSLISTSPKDILNLK